MYKNFVFLYKSLFIYEEKTYNGIFKSIYYNSLVVNNILVKHVCFTHPREGGTEVGKKYIKERSASKQLVMKENYIS